MVGTEKGPDSTVMIRDSAMQPNRDSANSHDRAVIRHRLGGDRLAGSTAASIVGDKLAPVDTEMGRNEPVEGSRPGRRGAPAGLGVVVAVRADSSSALGPRATRLANHPRRGT
jgi:hypothetical protein